MPDTNINTIKHHEHADSNTNCPTPSPLKQHEHQHPTVVAPKEVTRHRTSWAAYPNWSFCVNALEQALEQLPVKCPRWASCAMGQLRSRWASYAIFCVNVHFAGPFQHLAVRLSFGCQRFRLRFGPRT